MDENKTVGTEIDFDDWDDIDMSDVVSDEDIETAAPEAAEEQDEPADTAEEVEADHSQETPETAEPTEAQTETAEKEEANHSFTLKYMGEEKEFSREEVVSFAQKGMDYDRVRGKLDEANQLAATNAEAAEFVKALAAESGITPAELMDSVYANMLSKKEGISIDEAKGRLRLQKKEKELADKEKALEQKSKAEPPKPTAQDERRRELSDFFKAYPNVKPTDIPPEVFQAAHKEGIPLVAAYARHETARVRAELEAEKQNSKNKARSAGSASTSGKTTPMDAFDAAWYDGT